VARCWSARSCDDPARNAEKIRTLKRASVRPSQWRPRLLHDAVNTPGQLQANRWTAAGLTPQWSAVAKVSMATPLHRGGWGLKAMERGVGRLRSDQRGKSTEGPRRLKMQSRFGPVGGQCMASLVFLSSVAAAQFPKSHCCRSIEASRSRFDQREDWLGPAHVRRGRCAGPPIVPRIPPHRDLPAV
jgi:hypothetical protein